jgi:hypothetical protein
MPMARSLSTALALMVLFLGTGSHLVAAGLGRTQQQPHESPADEALKSGITRLERAESSEAVKAFDSALDLYAGAQRLEDAKHAYMQLFVVNRNYANVLMKAMKTWVEKRRTDAGGMTPAALAAFDNWVKERDALATATINLVHNSPDWK